MNTSQENLLCRYQYDPLDRLTAQDTVQRFYLNARLVAEVDGPIVRSLFQHETTVLAEHVHGNGEAATRLLATDHQASVLGAVSPARLALFAYSPYGNHDLQLAAFSLLGFTGERRDSVTGHYLLGNGYRAFNPALMRFNSPDSLSPFGKGGLNAYMYCLGDPVNSIDPTGHISKFLRRVLSAVGITKAGGSETDGYRALGRHGSTSSAGSSLDIEDAATKARKLKKLDRKASNLDGILSGEIEELNHEINSFSSNNQGIPPILGHRLEEVVSQRASIMSSTINPFSPPRPGTLPPNVDEAFYLRRYGAADRRHFKAFEKIQELRRS